MTRDFWWQAALIFRTRKGYGFEEPRAAWGFKQLQQAQKSLVWLRRLWRHRNVRRQWTVTMWRLWCQLSETQQWKHLMMKGAQDRGWGFGEKGSEQDLKDAAYGNEVCQGAEMKERSRSRTRSMTRRSSTTRSEDEPEGEEEETPPETKWNCTEILRKEDATDLV